MTAILVEPNYVRVEPDSVTARDVINLAIVLIEEQGWKQGDGGSPPGPWSLHGAIGEAAKLVTDGYSKDNTEARKLRDEANEELGFREGEDITFNDKAADVHEVVAKLREAL